MSFGRASWPVWVCLRRFRPGTSFITCCIPRVWVMNRTQKSDEICGDIFEKIWRSVCVTYMNESLLFFSTMVLSIAICRLRFAHYCGYDWRFHELAWPTLARCTRSWISLRTKPTRRVPRHWQWQLSWCCTRFESRSSIELRKKGRDRQTYECFIWLEKIIFMHT